MGVYIKDMEMPKNCLTCACTDSEYGECVLDPEKRCPEDYGQRAEWCPLVPVADVRPVVRCKDCKYWKQWDNTTHYLCTYVDGAKFIRNADDFCSRGEKGES